jgi:hypothetical protein
VDDPVIRSAESAMLAAEAQKEAVPLEELAIPLRTVPGHRRAALRIVAALEPDLVPVVDQRGARRGQLQGDGEAHEIAVPSQPRANPLGVVASEEVEHAWCRPVRGREPEGAVPLREVARGDRPLRVPGDELPQRVVHRPVGEVALQPVGGRLPERGDDVEVRIRPLDDRPELPPEALLDEERHVEPPSVDALGEPLAGDAEEVVAHLGIGVVELGQVLAAHAGRVVGLGIAHDRKSVDREPVGIRRVAPERTDVAERPVPLAAVVEDGIQNDAHAPLVRGAEESAERLEIAEAVVDPAVVGRVVAVIRVGLEDRREVERVRAELLDVVEPAPDAGEVAAEEVSPRRGGSPRLDSLRVDRGVRVGEAVGKDLVEDRVLEPGGRCRSTLRLGRNRRRRTPLPCHDLSAPETMPLTN